MKFTLKDGSPRKRGEVEVTVSKNGNMLEIGFEGYGECDAAEGCGSPVVIELYDGKLRVLVFPDINSDGDPTVIDLEGARESKRKPEPAPAHLAVKPEDQATPKKAPSAPAKPSPEPSAPVVKAPVAEPTDDDLAAFDAA